MEEQRDLGKDKIGGLLIALAGPAIVAQLVNLLYNMVDRIFIGHIPNIGGDALTGVGVTAPLVIIISSFAALIGMGGAPRVAIKMGQGNKKEAEEILGNSFLMLALASILLTVFFLIFNERLLLAFGASQVTLPYALDYMNIYTIGTFFALMSTGLNTFISTQGFSRTSMLSVVIGAVINIVLDPIFIFLFNMGVKGAAIATVVSQAVSALWIIRFLRGDRTEIKLKIENFKLDKNIIIPVLALGLSPFIMQLTESIITIAFNSNLQKYGGDVAVGAMTIMSSAMQFLMLPLVGLASGAQPILSYNFGAGNNERVEKTFKYVFIASLAFSTLYTVFCMVAPGLFSSIFTNDMEIIKMAKWGLRIFMGGGFLLGAQVACQQTFVALGNSKASVFLALLRKVFLLVPLIYIVPLFTSNKVFGVILAEPIADVIASITTTVLFFKSLEHMLENSLGSDNIKTVEDTN